MKASWIDSRTLLRVRVYDLACGYSVKEIAELLDIEESSVRAILRNRPVWWDHDSTYSKVNDLIIPHAVTRGRGIYEGPPTAKQLLRRRNKEKILIRTQGRTPCS